MELYHLPQIHRIGATKPSGFPMALGTDIVYLPRVEGLYQRYGNRFLEKVLTSQERAFCVSPVSLKVKVSRIASRIAAKEAVVKALGIGLSTMGNPRGTMWSSIELLREEKHAPKIRLYGKAAEVAQTMGIKHWLVSVSHDGDYATATVIGLGAIPQADVKTEPEYSI